MLETALVLSLISSLSSTFGYLSTGLTIATIAMVFYAIWAVGGVLAIMFHKPIERFATAHGAHAM
jgi:hypothetical protein